MRAPGSRPRLPPSWGAGSNGSPPTPTPPGGGSPDFGRSGPHGQAMSSMWEGGTRCGLFAASLQRVALQTCGVHAHMSPDGLPACLPGVLKRVHCTAAAAAAAPRLYPLPPPQCTRRTSPRASSTATSSWWQRSCPRRSVSQAGAAPLAARVCRRPCAWHLQHPAKPASGTPRKAT